MEFIGFRDSCLIQRTTGKDAWDNPVRETIYNGECLYEEGGTGYSRSIITRSPTIYIPGVDVQVNINDSVKVTTEYGRVIEAVVRIVRDINMPWRVNIEMTRIELKQAQGE